MPSSTDTAKDRFARASRARHLGSSLALAALATALLASCSGNTTGATNVGPTSAKLNAVGRCDNKCNVWFRYRLAEGPWYRTPSTSVPSTGGKDVSYSYTVGNLSPGSIYHFQICGNDQGVNVDTCGGPNGSSSYQNFSTPASGAPRVRLETYNVEYFDRGSLTQIKNDIQPPNATGADIVALEEVRQFGSGPSEADQLANSLGWNTGGKHVYFRGFSNAKQLANGCKDVAGCTTLGNAIISRFPIVNPGGRDLYWTHGLKRNIIWADVQVGGGKTMHVFATHLASIDPANRSADETYTAHQLEDAVNIVNFSTAASGSNQAVLLGDFNLPYDAYAVNDRPYDDTNARTFDPLTANGFHDWKFDRIPTNDSDVPIGNPCTSKAPPPSGAAYLPCTYVNPSPSDKRDYIWVKGYPLVAGRVPSNCPDANCNSDHRPYWTDVIP